MRHSKPRREASGVGLEVRIIRPLASRLSPLASFEDGTSLADINQQLVDLVCFVVWLIWFIWLVSFNQINKTNQMNKRSSKTASHQAGVIHADV